MKTFNKFALVLASAIAMSSAAHAQDIVYSGVSPASDDYQLGILWSGFARDLGITVSVVENGSVAGMRKAAQQEVDMVGIGSPHFLDAVAGTGRYVDDPAEFREAYAEMSAILALPLGMAQYVARTDSDIHEFTDLSGKTVGTGRPGGNAGQVTDVLFQIHGMGGMVDAQAIEYGPALEQVASGTMDATLVWGTLPNSVLDNASRQMDLRFVSPDPDQLEAFRNEITNGEYYVFQRIPAAAIESAYEGRIEAESDAYFWTFPYQIMVRNDISEETVYALTKALWENIEQVNAASASLSLISLENALTGISAPLHPGARRYYEEIGLL
jgi:TRAP transporter TAXI family solute receptor